MFKYTLKSLIDNSIAVYYGFLIGITVEKGECYLKFTTSDLHINVKDIVKLEYIYLSTDNDVIFNHTIKFTKINDTYTIYMDNRYYTLEKFILKYMRK